MLDNIVSKLILNQLIGVLMQLSQNGRRLFRGAMLQNALDNSASIWVRGEVIDLVGERRNDELQRVRIDAFDAFLNHVITVLVFDAF